MFSTTRPISAFALLSLLAACDADPVAPGGAMRDVDGSVATTEGPSGDADAGILVDPGPPDLCGDGIDQDLDGKVDENCNRVFVGTVSTSLADAVASGLLATSDAACDAQAQAAGLDGTFVAYLSQPDAPASTRLGGARGFVRTDGKPVADTATDLAAGRILYPIQFAADGTTGAANAVTLTKTLGQYDSDHDCADMTNFANGSIGAGATISGGTTFQSFGSIGCNGSTFAVYCVQTDHAVPLAPPVVASDAHRIFVSQAQFPMGGGLASADAICDVEADAAGLPGDYVAFLPTTTATAASRIPNDGDPVVRVDGVVVAPTTQAFFARLWRAPIAITATAGVLPGAYAMWTASPSPLVESDANCADYTSTNAAAKISAERANFVWGFTTTDTFDCATKGAQLVCVQL